MTATAEFLGQRCQVFVRSRLIPRISTQRNLGAHLRGADAYGVYGFGVQQVGNELVVAFEIQIAYVKKYYAVFGLATLPQDVNGLSVTLKQGSQMFGYERQLDHLGKWAVGKVRDDACRDIV